MLCMRVVYLNMQIGFQQENYVLLSEIDFIDFGLCSMNLKACKINKNKGLSGTSEPCK